MIADCNKHLAAAFNDEDERARIKQLARVAEMQRDTTVEALRRTDSIIHRAVRAEEVADDLRRRLDTLQANAPAQSTKTQRDLSVCARAHE